MATHTPDENSALRRTMAKNEARVKIPNMRKIPATNSGYTGVSHAVGPVSFPNGELNPFPFARDFAMLPVSWAKDAGASISRGIWCSMYQAKPSRALSATRKMSQTEAAAVRTIFFMGSFAREKRAFVCHAVGAKGRAWCLRRVANEVKRRNQERVPIREP